MMVWMSACFAPLASNRALTQRSSHPHHGHRFSVVIGSSIPRFWKNKRFMPELPEVETVANGVNARIAGDRIEDVWFSSKPEPMKTPPGAMAKALTGRTIERVRRVGKHIVFDFA